MGKHGPCYHCGVTSTPLWRNGPPDKPVLCNACGSRWRTKGTLMNYTPQHARDGFEVEEFLFTKERKMPFKSKEKMSKGKWNMCDDDEETEIGDYNQCFRKAVDEEMSNRSSSGSAVSYSESCAHVSGADVSEITGSFQSNVWDSIVPSRKRTCIIRSKPSSGEKNTKDALSCSKQSSVEKLTQDLHSIMYQQSLSLCASSEEDLLFENDAPMGFGEIGHGGMLIKRPDLENIEEESEASSFSAEKRLIVCSALPVPVHTQGFISSNTCNGKLKSTQAILEPQKRVKVSQERERILWERNSLLSFTDLKDIVSFDGFMKFLTSEEQHQLMKYLPSIDVSMPPESFKCMFDSPQFVEALSFFQQLLREGVFDLTFSQMKPEASKNLKRLALSDLVKSNLVEHYYELSKGTKYDRSREKQPESGIYSIGCSTSAHIKRPRINLDCSHNNEFPEANIIVKSPRRPCITWSRNHLPARNIQQDLNSVSESLAKEENGHISQDGLCQSPRSLFASPFHRSGILDSLQFSDANTDQELLLDVRCNTSFPDAELLSENWAQKMTGKNVCRPRGISENEGSVSCHSAVAFSSNHSINRH